MQENPKPSVFKNKTWIFGTKKGLFVQRCNTKKDLQCLISMLVVYLVGPAIYYVAALVAHLNGLETTTSLNSLACRRGLQQQQQRLPHSFKNALRRGMFTYKIQITEFFSTFRHTKCLNWCLKVWQLFVWIQIWN